MAGWIGVDLDGTLAHWEPERDIFSIGPPVKEMQERVISWIQHGRDVRIFTARVGPYRIPEDAAADFITRQVAMIQRWCERHLGMVLPVTCMKDFNMETLYDDRCVQVEFNTGKLIRHGIRLVPNPEPSNDLVGTAA